MGLYPANQLHKVFIGQAKPVTSWLNVIIIAFITPAIDKQISLLIRQRHWLWLF
jgi:hypothetical protein